MTNINSTLTVPEPDNEALLAGLKALIQQRTIMASLEAFGQNVGPLFKVALPYFETVFVSGAEAVRLLLVTDKDKFRWRNDTDPVTKLLGHGLLVLDDEEHDRVRAIMSEPLHRQRVNGYLQKFIDSTDAYIADWAERPQALDVNDEMRKIALVTLLDTLFGIDFSAYLDDLWQPILKSIDYISPGIWIVWPNAPRFGYEKPLAKLDKFFFESIRQRQAQAELGDDLLGVLIAADLDEKYIRDQLITMLIAGHDTNTALLMWALHLLAEHPTIQEKLQSEINTVCGTRPPTLADLKQLTYLNQVINETLRLYPPIHLGSRIANADIDFLGYEIKEGTRVMYSIYLTQRDPNVWPDAAIFDPDRFHPDRKSQIQDYTFLPFGGGKRNCIGMAFARLEAQVVLIRILQRYRLTSVSKPARPYMKATLEAQPRIKIKVAPR